MNILNFISKSFRVLGILCFFCFLTHCTSVFGDNFYEEPPLRVRVLDVSQGLGILLEEGGKFALYDTGPDSLFFWDSIAKYKIDTLEWVLISHFHRDHGGGFLEYPLQNKKPFIKKIWVTQDETASFTKDSIYKIAMRENIPIEILSRGTSLAPLNRDSHLQIEVLWPLEYLKMTENASSIVLLLKKNENKILFTGDLDSVAEFHLLELSPSLEADFLQVGHHGSAGSSSLRFLAQIAPKEACISVGKNNYGHPREEVLKKLNFVIGDSNRIKRTDEEGTLFYEF